jgi:hypothetical protein
MNRPVIAAGVRIAVMVIPSFDGQTGRFYAEYGAYRRNRRGCAGKRRNMLSSAWPGSPENGSAGGVVPMRTARAHPFGSHAAIEMLASPGRTGFADPQNRPLRAGPASIQTKASAGVW